VALGLVVAYAQPGPIENGIGLGSMMRSQMMQGHVMDQNANMKIMRELMNPAERLAMMDKIIDAKTVEERRAIITATQTEMEKRIKEEGITLPTGHSLKMISDKNCG
jgi:hypothetical protein